MAPIKGKRIMGIGNNGIREMNHLKDGATIAVIGAGPAGSFFSILALNRAREMGIRLNLVLFDGKNFLKEGPRGCNMCAGVISKGLLSELEQLGLPIPENRVQRLIDSYIFHTIEGCHTVYAPPGKGGLPVVFRGNGPRFSGEIGRISFDDYLLTHAVEKGAALVPAYIQDVLFPKTDRDRPVVRWKDGDLPADLVVAASGVSTEFAKKLEASGVRYRPPRCVRAIQTELFLGEESLEKHIGNSIHVFSIGLPDIRFAAIVPKSRFVTVSLVGKRDLDMQHLTAFLASPIVKRLFPDDWQLPERLCSCRPSLPFTGGKGFFGDRFLMVGDASMSRHYKNGIDSAFRTAQFAVDAVFKADLSARTLARTYGAPVIRSFKTENRYARILFALNDLVSPRRFWVNAHLYYVQKKPNSSTARTIFYLTWNLFTGQTSYRDNFRKCINPLFLFGMGLGALRWLSKAGKSKTCDDITPPP